MSPAGKAVSFEWGAGYSSKWRQRHYGGMWGVGEQDVWADVCIWVMVECGVMENRMWADVGIWIMVECGVMEKGCVD